MWNDGTYTYLFGGQVAYPNLSLSAALNDIFSFFSLLNATNFTFSLTHKDMWIYYQNTWNYQKAQVTAPSARYCAVSIFSSASNSFWLFGGFSDSTCVTGI
jgi:hypothetical protein